MTLQSDDTQIEHIETCLKEAKANGKNAKKKDMQIVVDRLERAKKFHGKVHGLLSNPVLEQFL